MDKTRNAESFARAYARLNETEKGNFSRIANKLLYASFICENKESDRNDYYEALKMISLLQDYFTILDYEVNLYKNDKVIHLRSLENYNHFNLKLNESVMLLLLRKIYALKSREISLNENVIVSVEEIHDAIAQIGYLDRRMGKSEFRDIIRLFKRFSLIENIGDIERDDSLIVIFPSVVYAVPYEELTQLDTMIKNYGREEQNETVDQDITD